MILAQDGDFRECIWIPLFVANICLQNRLGQLNWKEILGFLAYDHLYEREGEGAIVKWEQIKTFQTDET